MSSYKKLGKDMLLMTIGNFGSRLLSFVFVPFYTAVLSTEEYGISDLITTTVTLLLPFFTLTIFESMMRFSLDNKYEPKEIWRVGIKVETIGTLIFFAASPIILLTVLKDYYLFVVLYYIFTSLNRCVSYFTRGLNRVKTYAIAGVLQTSVIIVLNLFFLLVLRTGIEGYLVSHIIASAVASLYMFISAQIYKYGMKIVKVNKSLQKDMLCYSVPMIPNSVCWWVANVSDRYILTAFAGTSVTGIYSVAYKIPTIISALTTIFGNAWKLSAVEDFGSEKSRLFFEDIYSKLTTLMVVSASALLLLNKPMAQILFSKDFYQAWVCVPPLLLASVMHSYSEFFGTIYTSAYKTNFLVYSTLIGSAVNIILNFILIPKYQGSGAAIATLIGYFVIWICRVIHSRKIMKLQFHFKRDLICYILIVGQMFIACNSFGWEYIASAAIFIMIFFLMRSEIIDVVKMILKNTMIK